MPRNIEAIYEGGVLRPLSPLKLKEYLSFGVVSTLLTVRSKLRKGDGSIFRDKGEKKTSYFWLKNLSDGLNLLTSFLTSLQKP